MVLLLLVVVVLLLWAVLWLAFGLEFRFGVGLGLGTGSRLGGPRLGGMSGRVPGGGLSRLDAGLLGSPPVVGGPLAACFVAAALALAVALWMSSAVRGEEEVGDDDDDEDGEEVVFLGDGGCADMRARAALRAESASAAATAGRMEAISSGFWLGAGGCKGPAAIQRPGVPIWSAAVCGGGVGLRSPPSGFGWAALLQFARVCASASAGGNSSHRLHAGVGRVGLRVMGLRVGGVWGSLGGMGVPWRVGLFVPGVCGLPGVGGGEVRMAGASVAGVCGCLGGEGRPVSRGLGLCTLVGGCGPLGGEWEGRGGGRGAGLLCGMSALLSACSGVHVWPRVGSAVWRWSSPSIAAAARISQMRLRFSCTSWSVVGRGYFKGGLWPMRRRTQWTA